LLGTRISAPDFLFACAASPLAELYLWELLLLLSLVGVYRRLRLFDFYLATSDATATPALLPLLSATRSLMFALFRVIFPGFDVVRFLFASPDPSTSSAP